MSFTVGPSRPHFTVVRKRPDGQEIRYDANHIAYTVHEGRYCLQFQSSGSLAVFPIGELVSMDAHVGPGSHGGYCGVCDQPLQSWPSEDPDYGPKEINLPNSEA